MARRCLNCEDRKGLKRFDGEAFTVEHAGWKVKVEGLSGWRCGACGEVEFDAESARRYAAGGTHWFARSRAAEQGDPPIRRKLGLSQVAAARLTGRPQRVSRYERGEVAPCPPSSNPSPVGQAPGAVEGHRVSALLRPHAPNATGHVQKAPCAPT